MGERESPETNKTSFWILRASGTTILGGDFFWIRSLRFVRDEISSVLFFKVGSFWPSSRIFNENSFTIKNLLESIYKIKKHTLDKGYTEVFCDVTFKEIKNVYKLNIIFECC